MFCLDILDISPGVFICVLVELCEKIAPVSSVVYQTEVTFEEVNLQNKIKEECLKSNIKVHEVWGATLHHLQEWIYNIPTGWMGWMYICWQFYFETNPY